MQDINEIKIIRKKLDLTQIELCKKAGVSQSLIAKIESNRIDPSYSSVKKIFTVIDELSKKKSLLAKEIMQKKIISVNSNNSVKDVVKIMKKHKISQVPVVDERGIVGIVSDGTLLNAFLNKKENINVGEVMDPAPPIVEKGTDVEAVSGLLKFFNMVIVAEEGKLIGLITKADLLEKMY